MTGYLGLGSNVGDRRANLQAAVDALPAHGVRVTASSATYDTDPVGPVRDQPAFLNACVQIETDLAPEALLDACKAVERELGRALPGEAGYVLKGPRPIDVDLLLLGDTAYASERLTLPHEQVTSRRFVLIPLLELDFELRTPDGERLRDALARLPLDEGVTPRRRRARRCRRRPERCAQAAAGASGRYSAGIAPAATLPGKSGNSRSASWPAGRGSISGRRSARAISRRTLVAIWRSAAFGCSPPRTPSAIQASILPSTSGRLRTSAG